MDTNGVLQAEPVATGQSRSHVLPRVLADGAVAICLRGHFWALQKQLYSSTAHLGAGHSAWLPQPGRAGKQE